jgi:MFS family permease
MGLSRVFFGIRRREPPLGASLGGGGAAGLCLGGDVLAVFSPSPLLALGGCAVAGLAAGILWPGIFSLASRLFPRGFDNRLPRGLFLDFLNGKVSAPLCWYSL